MYEGQHRLSAKGWLHGRPCFCAVDIPEELPYHFRVVGEIIPRFAVLYQLEAPTLGPRAWAAPSMATWKELELYPMSKVHRETLSSSSHDSGCGSLCLTNKNETAIDHINPEVESPYTRPLLWFKVREYCRDAFSEFFGTMILVLFGDGVVAQVLLSHGQKGDYQSISWGWG